MALVAPRCGAIARRALDAARRWAIATDASLADCSGARSRQRSADAAYEMTDINPRAREHAEYREAVRELCRGFDSEYWQRVEADAAYPEAFVTALTDAGWLAALIPTEYGGGGLGVTEASVILEEINRSGANSGACHAQMYIMGTLLRHGSAAQKQRYLPRIASGELRLQSFAVTEPTTGTDTTQHQDVRRATGDRYVVNGQKVWISRVQHSDLMLLLARTTPLPNVDEEVRRAVGLSRRPRRRRAARHDACGRSATWSNHETNEVFFDDFEVPAREPDRRGGQGLSLHPRRHERRANSDRRRVHRRRLLVHRSRADVCVDRDRVRPADRAEPGHPVSDRAAYANVRAADLMRYEAARLFDAGQPCGAEANMAKLLAADASWEAANVCLQTHGGFGFAAEYDVERKFRETRLYQVAPISTNLILSYIGEHVLGMPRSF